MPLFDAGAAVASASEGAGDDSDDAASEGGAAVVDENVGPAVPRESICTPATRVWQTVPRRTAVDALGQGRIPAFWYTLNLPYNYLFDIHRFRDAVERCRSSCLAMIPGPCLRNGRSTLTP